MFRAPSSEKWRLKFRPKISHILTTSIRITACWFCVRQLFYVLGSTGRHRLIVIYFIQCSRFVLVVLHLQYPFFIPCSDVDHRFFMHIFPFSPFTTVLILFLSFQDWSWTLHEVFPRFDFKISHEFRYWYVYRIFQSGELLWSLIFSISLNILIFLGVISFSGICAFTGTNRSRIRNSQYRPFA